ncbi:hypothetical protein EJ05DRAFT_474271 [Pseudovirgaria hyperparasitica]|uniref:Pre-rRNA-processing protein TSR2 n=1 Tax=Pseudovirgaria hyperparasitica TaxID=470096 RepID=A0A6A6WES0_9PEZI|nr:uncharacterized protein EJ05DRAFT_474271 [Pseudovirgaria hyperparasitica]KAF2760386.1 hypothetical protein EJ05DRAFT_474271 [Pseudovirgaria hyperparasitica]
MATQNAPSQPQPIPVVNEVDPKLFEEKFGLGVWHALSQWSALTKAVQEGWGGGNTSEKRDWFAGAIADQLLKDPTTPGDEIQFMLLDVMSAEFDVDVEDDSEETVVANILKVWKECTEGIFATVDEWQRLWTERQGREEIVKGEVEDREEEADSDEYNSDDDDVNMDEAPALIHATKKDPRVPEIDEDGFEKVVSKKKR